MGLIVDQLNRIAQLEDEVQHLQAELVTMREEQEREINFYVAELAALRPWAEVGKRMLNSGMHFALDNRCMFCGINVTKRGHAPDCPIPSLLAQL